MVNTTNEQIPNWVSARFGTTVLMGLDEKVSSIIGSWILEIYTLYPYTVQIELLYSEIGYVFHECIQW